MENAYHVTKLRERPLHTEEIDEVPVTDVVHKIKAAIRFIANKWAFILSVGLSVGTAVLIYSIVKPPTYTATCTFVLDEENKQPGMFGQYAGLASLAGINLSSANGLFQGDNIIELYKSRSMIERTLLQKANIKGKEQLLIDRYVDFNRLRTKWKNDDLGMVYFSADPSKFDRKQDSLITDIVDRFNDKLLSVTKPDKKLSIIKVEVISKDEPFAQAFTNSLVQTVNDFYIKTITQKAARNVALLQRQADSVKNFLNTSIGGVAYSKDAAPNANPFLESLRVPSQRKQVDVQAGTAIYSGIVQNLEIAKISLQQATPLIQLIDKPVLPLKNDRLSKVEGFAIGALIGCVLAIAYLYAKLVFKIFAQ